MVSQSIHAAALAHARQLTNDHSAEALVPFVDAFETGWHRGFHDRPKPATFPLSGQREFLRVLGQYVAEDIEIFHPATGRYGRLKGLPATYEGQGEPLADVEFYADAEAREEGGGDVHEPVGKILPVLYGFEDLATEIVLGDGRRVVPAVEVARLSYRGSEPVAWNEGGAHVGFDRGTIKVRVADGLLFWLWADMKGVSLEAIDWLRQHHFAVGLRPEQYKRKVVAVAVAACGGDCASCEVGKEVGRG